MSAISVELTLEPDEAEAIWDRLNHYYPYSREAFGSAMDKLVNAMDRAGVKTDCGREGRPEPPYLASGV